MDIMECDRIVQYFHNEQSPSVQIKLVGHGCENSEETLEKVKQVMLVVANARDKEWPDDGHWEKALPEWFVNTFKGHSLEEIMADPNLWTFGSWIDAMKNPGWEWWSSFPSESVFEVNLWSYSYPYSMGMMDYLMRVAGCPKVITIEA